VRSDYQEDEAEIAMKTKVTWPPKTDREVSRGNVRLK